MYFSHLLTEKSHFSKSKIEISVSKAPVLVPETPGVYISNGHFPHEPTSQEILSDAGSKLLTNTMCFTVDVILFAACRPIQYGLCWIYLSYVHTKGML